MVLENEFVNISQLASGGLESHEIDIFSFDLTGLFPREIDVVVEFGRATEIFFDQIMTKFFAFFSGWDGNVNKYGVVIIHG